jgi:DNA-binding NarL/FixJ family response regulator
MLRVLLADADPATRKALALLLNHKLGLQDIVEAGDGEALLAQLTAARPDAVILDWTLPGRPPLAACRPAGGARLVVMSVDAADEQAVRAAGATFLHKAAPAEQALAQLRAVLAETPAPSVQTARP